MTFAQEFADIGAGKEYVLASRTVLTMREDQPFDGYVYVKDGRVVEARPGGVPAGLTLPTLDLGERAIAPGFIDPHIHFAQTSVATYGTVDCDVEKFGSIELIIETLRENAEQRSARGGWLIGQSNLFSDRRLAERRLPTRADLDRVSTSFPVVLRCGTHVTVCNSVAIDRLTEDLRQLNPDQAVDRDEDGPTGVIRELFHELGVPDLDPNEVGQAMVNSAARLLTANGVTTIGEITDTVDSVRRTRDLVTSGAIPQRVNSYLCVPWTLSFDEGLQLRNTLEDTERYRVAGIKLFADGGFSAGGAAVEREYRPQFATAGAPRGRLAYTREQLARLLARAGEADLQVAVHTNGERTQRQLAEAMRQIRLPSRVRFEHAGNFVSDWSLVDEWNSADTAAVIQPSFIWMMSSFLPEYLGDYAQAGRMPYRTLLERGVPLAASSDGTGSEPRAFDPLAGIRMMINRLSCMGEVIDATEAITPLVGMEMYTRNAARALGLEGEIGELATGYRADLAVFDRNPLTDMDSVKVTATIIGGSLANASLTTK